jgi:hypothetical protein
LTVALDKERLEPVKVRELVGQIEANEIVAQRCRHNPSNAQVTTLGLGRIHEKRLNELRAVAHIAIVRVENDRDTQLLWQRRRRRRHSRRRRRRRTTITCAR